MSRFVIVELDDWAGLYRDGVRVAENHSISYYDLAHAGAVAEVRDLADTEFDAVLSHSGGGLPRKLEDVPTRD